MRTGPVQDDKDALKIYTGSGDRGETSLLEGIRVSKHSLRVEVNGSIDELNSWIGYVRAMDKDKIVEALLSRLQPRLNILCSDIAAPLRQGNLSATPRVLPDWVRELEDAIDRLGKELLAVSRPILPGGSPIGASLHLARTVCRRAELLLVHLQAKEGDLNPEAIRFLNRLSDYLFMLARWANHRAGIADAPDVRE
jgi:cob(I)alamin adenosyltransferase